MSDSKRRPPWQLRLPLHLEIAADQAIKEDGPNRNRWVVEAVTEKLKKRKSKS